MSKPAPLSRTENTVVSRASACAELDARVLGARRVLPRVAQQVVEQALHEPRIGVDRELRLDAALDALTRILLVQVVDDRLRQRRQVDALVEQLLPRDARQRQQAVDDVGRAPHAGLDAIDAAADRIVHRGLQLVAQQAGLAGDRAERRAQVVRSGSRERFELLVGEREPLVRALQLGGARRDAAFQLAVQLRERGVRALDAQHEVLEQRRQREEQHGDAGQHVDETARAIAPRLHDRLLVARRGDHQPIAAEIAERVQPRAVDDRTRSLDEAALARQIAGLAEQLRLPDVDRALAARSARHAQQQIASRRDQAQRAVADRHALVQLVERFDAEQRAGPHGLAAGLRDAHGDRNRVLRAFDGIGDARPDVDVALALRRQIEPLRPGVERLDLLVARHAEVAAFVGDEQRPHVVAAAQLARQQLGGLRRRDRSRDRRDC